jgi:hypothetical protein
MVGGKLIGKDLEGTGRGLIEVLLLHFCGGTEGNHEHPLRIALFRVRSTLINFRM